MLIRAIVQRNASEPADASFGRAAPTSTGARNFDSARPRGAELMPEPREILDSIGETVYDWDLTSDRLTWGPNAQKVLGVDNLFKICSGRKYNELLSPVSQATRQTAIFEANAQDLGEGVRFQVRYGLQLPGPSGRNELVWVEDTGRWFAGPQGAPQRAHGLVRVITGHYEAEQKLEFKSRFDALTGCLNRAHLIEATGNLLKHSPDRPQPFCLLLAGIENLVVLNRTYGYDAADEVIAGLARRLKSNIRSVDLIARYAGNKFAILLNGCDPDQMSFVAQRLLDCVSAEPFETSVGPIPVGLRVGGVSAPLHGRKPHILFQNVEEALDSARASTEKRFIAYQASLSRNDARMQAIRLSHEIVSALNEGRIVLAYQPIIASASRTPAFYEALIRLRQTDGSLLSPGAILPSAEKSGLIQLLDQRVLELAMARLAREPHLSISVNVSGLSIFDPDWLTRLRGMLARAPQIASRLIIELTETVVISDIAALQDIMEKLRELGVRLAMDDFGAGHTSFRNLRSLSFDLIKMDGAFIQNLSRSSDDRFFIRTLIDLARHLNVPVVAEWVETEEAASTLTEWGVEYLQGSHFGSAALLEEEQASSAA